MAATGSRGGREKGCFAISNAVSVSFGAGGSAGKVSIVWDGGGPVPNAQAFLDVTGYIL